MIHKLAKTILATRLWALILKETRQIIRNKQLLFLLIFPPTIQLFIYGFALSPEVEHLRLGVVDYSLSPTSRELVSALVENRVFDLHRTGGTADQLAKHVQAGKLDAGMIIPPEFNRKIRAGMQANVQIMLDGVDANSAGIAAGYISQIITAFNQHITGFINPIKLNISFLYNPGLISSWFFVPGVMGLILNITGSLVSSTTLVKEKDSGTLEQLLMTPANAWEILIAKIAPLFILLMGNVLLSLSVGMLIFHVPFRGNFLVFMFISALYVFVAISIGLTLATISQNQRQAILTSFFFNLPLVQLSGAVAPIESMPRFFQILACFNPLRYYIICIRGILLRGAGFDVLWPSVLALSIFAALLLAGSAYKFRRQLS